MVNEFSSHYLQLKEGMPIMLLRNINPAYGTRLLIMHLRHWIIEANIITGSNVGEKVRIFYPIIQIKYIFIQMI